MIFFSAGWVVASVVAAVVPSVVVATVVPSVVVAAVVPAVVAALVVPAVVVAAGAQATSPKDNAEISRKQIHAFLILFLHDDLDVSLGFDDPKRFGYPEYTLTSFRCKDSF
jgi:hypothetical protein